MTKTVFSRVLWLARGTSMALGLAVMLAVVLGVATTALAAVPGDPFKLGRINSIDRLSTLVGSASGAMLKVDNNGGGPALNLEANSGRSPLVVNAAAGKATNLNADKIDNQDASAFLRADQKAQDADRLDGIDSSAFVEDCGFGSIHGFVRINGWRSDFPTTWTRDPQFVAYPFNCTGGAVEARFVEDGPLTRFEVRFVDNSSVLALATLSDNVWGEETISAETFPTASGTLANVVIKDSTGVDAGTLRPKSFTLALL